MQSSFQTKLASKLHVGIIMDGNGRWATRRGLSRLRGHEAGVEAIRRVVEAAPEQGVGTLTLYAFSSDNWRRPKAEVAGLMALLRFYLAAHGVNLYINVFCRLDGLMAGALLALFVRSDAPGDRTEVPGPATLTLLGIGTLTLVGSRAWRRRKAIR